MNLIRSISGIRGIIGENFSPSIASEYVKSFCSLQSKNNPLIIARDTRNKGYEIAESIKKTITSLGIDVYDIDIAPTPVIQHLTKKLNTSGGIMITASHNPEEWNGLKFIDSDGCFINEKKNKELFKNFDEKQFIKNSKNQGRVYNKKEDISIFINDLLNLKFIDVERIKKKRFKVIVDSTNGANYKLLPKILRKLNCDVVELYCNKSGKFNRNPEPLPENLQDLSELVLKNNADIGFASDPDGDRLSIVNDKGQAIGEERTLVLCSDDYYNETQSNSPLVTNLSSTMCLDYIAKTHSVDIFRSAVGEANVIKMMQEKNCSIGGEGNGGVIVKDLHLGRDSLIAATMILNKLSKSKDSISTIDNNFPKYYMIKNKISIPDINLDSFYKSLINKYSDATADIRDGLKLTWIDKWIHIRSSNTEPIIRIIGESTKQDIIQSLIFEISNHLNQI